MIHRLTFALLFAIPVLAFSCQHPPADRKTPLARAEWTFAAYDIVFEGTVDHVELKNWPPKVVPGKTVSNEFEMLASFTGIRFYRGSAPMPLVVVAGHVGANSGFPFEPGHSYLVAAWVNVEGQLITADCASSPLESAGTALRMLRGEPPNLEDIQDVPAGSPDDSIAGSGPGKLCGKVTLSKSIQIEELDVQVWKLDRDLKPSPFAVGEVQAQANGSFCVGGLEPGKYVIGAQAIPDQRGVRYIGYYPGTTQKSEATPVGFPSSTPGSKVEFPLLRQPLYFVRGRVYGTVERMHHLWVGLINPNLDGLNIVVPAFPYPDGSFQLDNVPPGKYLLFAYSGTLDIPEMTFLSLAQEVEISGDREGLKLDLIQK